jgi:hypothetical protein
METIKRPSDATIQQIDFVIQGLENGKYKEIPTEVEFHEKLKGADAPSFLFSLLHALEEAQIEIVKLRQLTDQQHMDITDLTTRLIDLETAKQTNYTDIQTLAKGIKYAINPEPLDKVYELQEISNWISGKGVY